MFSIESADSFVLTESFSLYCFLPKTSNWKKQRQHCLRLGMLSLLYVLSPLSTVQHLLSSLGRRSHRRSWGTPRGSWHYHRGAVSHALREEGLSYSCAVWQGSFFLFHKWKKKPETKMCSGSSKRMGLAGVRNSSLVSRTYGILKVLKKKRRKRKWRRVLADVGVTNISLNIERVCAFLIALIKIGVQSGAHGNDLQPIECKAIECRGCSWGVLGNASV